MSLYSRGARRALAALVAVSAFLSACANDRGVAPESVVRRLPPRPQAALAPAGGATRGALLGEVSFTLPDTGAASGILTLTAPGTATGPVLIEVAGPIQLSNGTIPVTDALNPGAVMYFRSNGDLYVRYLTFGLFSVSSGGVRSYMPSPDVSAGDSVAMVDDSAAFHGITVIWETAQEEWSGLNASDPGFTHACPIMVSFICIVPPPFVAGRISAVGPHGTIHIQAYALQGGADHVKITKGTNDMVAPKGLGQDRLQLTVAVVDGSTHQPIPNRDVTLALAAIEPDAGHMHTGNKPTGELAATVNTGATGAVNVVYHSSPVSGRIIVRGASGGASDAVDTISVGVPGLVALAAAANISLIGRTDDHPDNHWGTSGMVGAVGGLADSLARRKLAFDSLPARVRGSSRFPAQLGVNDMSLVLGGLFDADAGKKWLPPHAEHRTGSNADIDVRRGTADDVYGRAVSSVWHDALHRVLGDERTAHNHIHLKE